MSSFKTADGTAKLESFMKATGGAPKEWYVGISADAEARLAQHGMQDNSLATWIQCEDEATAREIERYFLQTGAQGDAGGGSADKPPTQVYVFRAPKLTSFRDWLRTQEEKNGSGTTRSAKRTEWVLAANRFIQRCRAWLTEADSAAILDLRLTTLEKAETGLGRYEVPLLIVVFGATRVQIVPFARNTTRVLNLAPGVEVQAEGRVDITNGIEKWTLYRTRVEEKERWYALPEHGQPVEFNQDVFMAIMEDLLS